MRQRIGEELEAAYGERVLEVAPELAMHFERSRDHRRVVRYLGIAAARARQRGADNEALAYLEPALVESQYLNDAERLPSELDVRMAPGAVLGDLYGYASERVREHYERAEELSASA